VSRPAPHLVACVASHGWGHLSQTIPMVSALHARLPGLRTTVRTALPAPLVRARFEAVGLPIEVYPVGKTDQIKRDFGLDVPGVALGEDWMIVVTTDHGRDARTGKGHGGQSERERTTWIVTNQSRLSTRFTRGTPAIVDIAPSILEHLRIRVPAALAQEMDGVSFLRGGAR
jgi:hypothetical protein